MTAGLSTLGLFFSDSFEYSDEMSKYIQDCYDFGIGRDYNSNWSREIEKDEIERLLREHNMSALHSNKELSKKEKKRIQNQIDGIEVDSPRLLSGFVFYSVIALIIYFGIHYFS